MKNVNKYVKALVVSLALAGAGHAYADVEENVMQSVVSSQPQVKVVNGHIEITVPGDEPRHVSIYALTGQVIKSFVASPGLNTVDLPKGYYIVTCDRFSSRVIVK